MDLVTRHREWMRSRIERSGFAVQEVLAPTFLEPGFAYTVGLSMRGVPELILFGADGPGPILDTLGRRLLENPRSIRASMVVRDAVGDGHPVRIDRVLPRWRHQFGKAISMLAGSAHAEVLQVVVADHEHRWPEEPRVDPRALLAQPLLKREHPWLRPITRGRDLDRFAGTYGGDRVVLVPVIERGDTWTGQYEAVEALQLAEALCRIVQPPCAADWVAAGAIVEVGPRPKGLRTGAHGLVVRVVDPGPRRNLSFRTCFVCEPFASTLTGFLWSLVGAAPGGTMTVSSTPKSFHLSTDEPDMARDWLRPLLRDGHLAEQGLRSSLEEPTLGCDEPRCAFSEV